VLKVRSRFQLEGIKGPTLSAPEQQRLFADGVDPADVDFEGSDLERKVTNAGTNVLLVRQFMEEALMDPSGALPGKTIVFALTRAHARRLQGIFDTLYPQHAGTLARVITADDPRAHGRGGLVDQFRRNDMPRIAISVDMLDTGVDVREVVNLVFAKPVYSCR
jgi:type I restriction enzyme R subunit